MLIQLLELFTYGFMIRAFLAGAMLGIIAPLIGTFLVTKRYSMIADSLAHIALSGIAVGMLLGIYPLYTALLVVIMSAVLIEILRMKFNVAGEVALAMFLYGGLALALILVSFSRGFSADLMSYLFGSITTVSWLDLILMAFLSLMVIVICKLLYKPLLYISFNEEAAVVSGLPVARINLILIVLAAIVIGLAMKVVGLLLIGAMMVIPVVTAMQVSTSFKQVIITSTLLGFVATVLGLLLAYFLNIVAGGAIVFVALCQFLIFSGWQKLRLLL